MKIQPDDTKKADINLTHHAAYATILVAIRSVTDYIPNHYHSVRKEGNMGSNESAEVEIPRQEIRSWLDEYLP